MRVYASCIRAALAFALAGCAATSIEQPNGSVTTGEVAAYVRANWSMYAPRVAYQLGTQQHPELISLAVTQCDVYQTATCVIVTQVRLGDEVVEHAFDSSFARRRDGSLSAAIRLTHDWKP
jgi:hypothetical protein